MKASTEPARGRSASPEPVRRGLTALLALAVLTFAGLAGCTTNPATGKMQLATMMSAEGEAKAGAEAHPKIVQAYGGVYDDPKLGAYVAQVTARIVKGSDRPDIGYRVTILDSPVINAFALPGGYVYVTRGLLSLVDDEAELAGVLGHEIGHVIARHGAQRQTAALGASVVGAVLGAVVGSSAVNDVVGLGGRGLLAGYSRDQEYEADALGVRYLAQSGYDPYAEADFLETMAAEQALDDRITGQKSGGTADWLASHPATPDRVKASRGLASATGMEAGAGDRNRETLLRAVDGLLYGDAPEQGMVRGRSFVHPKLGITFTAPPGFTLVNTPKAVIGFGPDGTRVNFDAAKKSAEVEIGAYLASVWGADVDLTKIDRFTINGLKAAGSATRIGKYDARLVAIETAPETVYRFLMGTLPSVGTRHDAALRDLVMSFHRLSDKEVREIKPLRIRVVTVGRGDTAESLGTRMEFPDFRTERFRVLNGLSPDAKLKPGTLVKIVAD